MMWGYSFSGPGMLMMSLGAIVFIVLIAVLIWTFIGRQNTNVTQPAPTPSALETLRQRYAHGEIDTATFEQMSAQLGTRDQEPLVQNREPVEGIRY